VAGWVLVGVGILILAGLCIAYLLEAGPAKPVGPLASELNQPSVNLVSYMLIDDLEVAQSNEKSLTGKTPSEDLMGWMRIDRKTTARDYESAYDANEIAADNAFKGKTILLSGTIDSIDKDFTDAGYITLQGSGLMGVHAQLNQDVMSEAASFHRGQQVNFVCQGSGKVVTIAGLDNCEPFNDYLEKLDPSIESKVADFLNGKIALHAATADLITKMYVMGLFMPTNSPCMNGKRESCEAEFAAQFKDGTKLQSAQNQAKQMMANLKVN